MNIRVKFFASLREQVGIDEEAVSVDAGSTVDQVWQGVTGQAEMPSNVLIAINMEYVEPGTVVADGDEVAFFPPVTGG